MGSLSELLSNIYELPAQELQPRIPESERPNEMALLEQVMPAIQVRRMRENRIGFKRACFIRNGRAEIEIRLIRNDVGHKLVASYDSTGVTVLHTTDHESKPVAITSVLELHEYILSVVSIKETSDTT